MLMGKKDNGEKMNNKENLDIENMTKEQLEQLKRKLNGKTLKINNVIESERAFAEIIAEPAKVQQENIQRRRDERYEEMIAEAKEVESPMSRKNR